jgi:hypothetical protein
MPAAWQLRRGGKSPEDAVAYLREHITRRPDRHEIEQAVAKVYNTPLGRFHRASSLLFTPKKPFPAKDDEQIAKVAGLGLGLVDLWEASPIRLDDDPSVCVWTLKQLFPGDPLLCVGRVDQFDTLRLSEIKAPEKLSHIVPSPMTDKYGLTQDGKISQRTAKNTGPRRFLVYESDGLDKDTQAAVLLHLAELAPLTLAVDSGGKSLHGWFYCQGIRDELVRKLFARICLLGGDPALWNKSQMVRMPGGMRDNGNRQGIIFFNPDTIKDKDL